MTARAVSFLVVLGMAIGLALVTWPELVGLSRAPIAAHVVSLRPLAVIGAIVLAVGFALLALRLRPVRALASSIAVLLVAFSGANAGILVARGHLTTSVSHSSGITVLSWNTLGDEPGAEAIAALAVSSGANVLSLPETTNEFGQEVAAIMAGADQPMTVLTVSAGDEPAKSTTLLVAQALGEYRIDEDAPQTAVLPTVAAVPVDGSGPTLVAVHTLAPIPPMILAWQADLQLVAGLCEGDNVILAGDFNATVEHFAGLGTRPGALGECADAALSAGSAGLGTWPSSLPAVLGAPIDHVLATPQWRVLGVQVIQTHDHDGSDHRPIVVQLVGPDA